MINWYSCKQWISVLISVCILCQGMLGVPEHILSSNEVSLPTREAPALMGIWHRITAGTSLSHRMFVSWESNKGNHNLSCSTSYYMFFLLLILLIDMFVFLLLDFQFVSCVLNGGLVPSRLLQHRYAVQHHYTIDLKYIKYSFNPLFSSLWN